MRNQKRRVRARVQHDRRKVRTCADIAHAVDDDAASNQFELIVGQSFGRSRFDFVLEHCRLVPRMRHDRRFDEPMLR